MKKLLTLIAVMLLGFLIVACEPGEDSQVFQYDVVFDLDGGAPNIETQTIWENRTAKRPIDPVKEGYEFLYWANSATLTKWDFVNDRVKEDLTLIAIWGEMHLVIFDLGFENKILDQFIVSDETKLEQPQTPIRNGYTFNGWTLNDEIFDFETVITEDTKLLASWNANQYKITFDSNGGSLVDPIIQDFDTPINKPNDPLLEGHRFLGWFIDIDLEEEYIFDHIEDVDLTLYAKWEINEYTITFDSNEGEEVSDLVLTFGEEIELPTPIRHAWIFIEWQLDGKAFTLNKMPASDLVLTATWSQIPVYNVLFDLDYEGSVSNTVRVLEGELLDEPVIPIRLGYTFRGWELSGESFDFDLPILSDLTLKALWDINEYTITFESNDGTEIDAITQDFDTAVEAPIEPTRAGYTFNGWFVDEALTEEYTFTTMPANNLTLYANWDINEYTITFESNEGSNVDAITQNYNTILKAPLAPSRVGYTFNGWFVDEALTEEYTFTTMPANNLTLYAKWEINEYTITFNSNGGSLIDEQLVEYEGTVTKPNDPTRTGYEFTEWQLDGIAFDFDTPITENIELVAVWLELSYVEMQSYLYDFGTSARTGYGAGKLTFTNGDGVEHSLDKDRVQINKPNNYNSQLLVLAPVTDTKVAYIEFDLTKFSGLSKIEFMYSTWSQAALNRIIDFDDARIGLQFLDGDNWSYTDETNLVETITFETYLKASFEVSQAGLYRIIYEAPSAATGNTTQAMTIDDVAIFEKFDDRLLNKVSFDLNYVDAPLFDDVYVLTNQKVAAPQNPTRLGYSFVEWQLNEETFNFNSEINEDIVLTALWEVNEYTITFESNEGSIVDPITQDFDTEVNKPNDPSLEGYTFNGWFTNEALTEAYQFTTMPANNLTLYASWSINTYTISFNTDGGDAIASIQFKYNESISSLPTPNKDSWNFVEWQLDGQLFELTNMPAYNIELVAIWTQITTFTVTFNLGYDEVLNEETVAENELVKEPEQPIRAGYEFTGWQLGGEAFDFGTPITENIELVAVWKINVYTITFDSNGGSSVDTQEVEYNQLAILETPELDGNKFLGWFKNLDELKSFDFNTPITSDLELIAKWEKAFDYTETFKNTELTTSYADGSFTGVGDVVWTYGHSRDQGDFAIDEAGIMLRRASDSYIEATFEDGVKNLYFEFRKAFTGTSERQLEVIANGIVVGETIKFGTTEPDNTIYSLELDLDIAGPVTIRIKNVGSTTGNRQTVIDNIKWTKMGALEQHQVTFDLDYDGKTEVVNVYDNQLVALPTNPTRDGYSFVVWQLDGIAFDFNTPIVSDLTLVAIWEEITLQQYSVTFDLGYDDVEEIIFVYEEELVLEPENPVREGFKFIEWQLDGVAFDFNTPITSDLTLVAIWEEESTEPVEETIIILQSDFGETNGWAAYSLRTDQTIENGLNDPNPDGNSSWDILGGNVNNTGWDFIRMGGKVASTLTNPQAYLATNFTFTEKVTKIIIEIIALDSATSDEKIYLQESSDGINWTTITSQITKIGDLEFNNLNIETNKYIRFVFERASTTKNQGTDIKNITFFATISSQTTPEEGEYIISFNTDGGSTIEDIIVKEGNKAIAPTEPTKSGFNFIGWFLEDTLFDFDTPITGNLTLTAKWEEREESEEAVATIKAKEGNKKTAIEAGDITSYFTITNSGSATLQVNLTHGSAKTQTIFNNGAGETRLYVGLTLEINVPEAYVITNIKITTSQNGGAVINGTKVTGLNMDIAVTELSAVTIFCDNGQVRIKNIEITYGLK